MSFLFQNRCYTTTTQLAEAVASSCQTVSGGQIFECSPSFSQVRIKTIDLVTGLPVTDIFYDPPQIVCDVDLTDLTPVLFEISLIWIAAFIVAVIAKRLMK